MYSTILEVKFAYVVVRLFVYDLTSKHVPNKRVIRCTNKLPIVNMVMHCQRPIMQCALLMNINYNGYFTQWLRITQLRNESQSQTFLRNNISIFGKLSFRQTVRSAKSCPFGKMSVRQNPFGKTSVGKMSVRQNVFRQKCLSAKCLSAKCPGTLSSTGYLCDFTENLAGDPILAVYKEKNDTNKHLRPKSLTPILSKVYSRRVCH